MEVVPDSIDEIDLERQFSDTLAALARSHRQRRFEQLRQKPLRELSAEEKQEYTQLLREK